MRSSGSSSGSPHVDYRSKLTQAWLDECGPTGRCVASRLSKVLTAAGWNVSTYSAGSGVVHLKGATTSDVMYMLKALGHSDRDVAKALYPLPNTLPSTGLTVSLDDIMPYFLRKMQGMKAVPNTLLARSVLGGAWGRRPCGGGEGGRGCIFLSSLLFSLSLLFCVFCVVFFFAWGIPFLLFFFTTPPTLI